MPRKWAWLLGLVAAGVALDQITKQLAHGLLRGRGVEELVPGVLELQYVRNPGAFFSLGADLEPGVRMVFFVLVSAVASALIVWLYASAEGWLRWALVCLLGGALGNLIDRVLYGEVIDFIHLYWRGRLEWATFNVADVWIAAGLVILGADLFRRRPAPSLGESRS